MTAPTAWCGSPQQQHQKLEKDIAPAKGLTTALTQIMVIPLRNVRQLAIVAVSPI